MGSMVGGFRPRQAFKLFQTLGSNVKPKRLPSILFLGLLNTSKFRSISYTPIAHITSDIFFSFFSASARR